MPSDYTDTRPERERAHTYRMEPAREPSSTGALWIGGIVGVLAILAIIFLFAAGDDDTVVPAETTNSIEVAPTDGAGGAVDVEQEPGAAIEPSTGAVESVPADDTAPEDDATAPAADDAAPAGDDATTGN